MLSRGATRCVSRTVCPVRSLAGPFSSASAKPAKAPLSASPKRGQLVRDFIRDALYAPKIGYFNASRVINSPGVINFSALLGRSQYEKRLQELYYAGVQGWSTPVEIFQPYYAQAILRFILSHLVCSVNDAAFATKLFQQPPRADADRLDTPMPHHLRLATPLLRRDRSEPLFPLRIVEVGAGNGTCALNILDHLQAYYPSVYSSCRYTVLEISESLAAQQRALLAAHGDRVSIVRHDAVSWRAATPSDEHTFVIGLEVLDNLPHDKVAAGLQVTVVPKDAADGTDSADPASVAAAAHLLNKSAQPRDFEERAGPVTDPDLGDVLALWRRYEDEAGLGGGPAAGDKLTGLDMPWWARLFVKMSLRRAEKKVQKDVVYLPTDAMRLLKGIKHNFPSHTVVLADFDRLPSTERAPGVLAPVVARKAEGEARGETIDEDSYLAQPGSCDIFFPTDFNFLKFMYKEIMFGTGAGASKAATAAAGAGAPEVGSKGPTDLLSNLSVDDALVHLARKQKLPTPAPETVQALPDRSLTAQPMGARGGHSVTGRGLRAVVDTAAVVGNGRFVLGFGETGKTETRNGFNPLLEDYTNMVFFVGARSNGYSPAAASNSATASTAAALKAEPAGVSR